MLCLEHPRGVAMDRSRISLRTYRWLIPPLICNSVSAIFVPLRFSSCWMYVWQMMIRACRCWKKCVWGDCSVPLPLLYGRLPICSDFLAKRKLNAHACLFTLFLLLFAASISPVYSVLLSFCWCVTTVYFDIFPWFVSKAIYLSSMALYCIASLQGLNFIGICFSSIGKTQEPGKIPVF